MPPQSPVPSLFLVRHARADAPRPGERDVDRALDARGEADAHRIAEAVRRHGWSLGDVVCSPARRCRETADILLGRNPPASLTVDPSVYDGPLDVYRTIVAGAAPDRPLTLIGHNPLVEQILRECLGVPAATRALPDGFTPGTVVAIAFSPDGAASRLVAVLSP